VFTQFNHNGVSHLGITYERVIKMRKFVWKNPRSNYHFMPNQFGDEVLEKVDTVAELKVILFVMRHTWGYNEFGSNGKKITLDEFVFGRMRKDKTRFSKGVGLSKSAVIRGIKAAIDHGFLKMVIDDSDGGRKERRYFLPIEGDTDDNENQSRGSKTIPQTDKKLPAEVAKRVPRGSETSTQRSHDDTSYRERHPCFSKWKETTFARRQWQTSLI